MIQSNNSVGFSNFKDFQDRKDCMFDWNSMYYQESINLAINALNKSQNINSLEARIVPKTNTKDLKNYIENIDKIQHNTYNICSKSITEEYNILTKKILDDTEKSDTNIDNNYFFALHFPKSIDDSLNRSNDFIPVRRYNKLRKNTLKRAKAITGLISNNYKARKRIRAIDGCTNEIGCRPEALCNEMRYVLNYNPVDTGTNPFINKSPINIYATYHAGEDYLDLADGLRAIYEAIHFIGLKRNDRIGHAVALGIYAENYYKLKEYNITSTKQELLDNLLWLINYADENDVHIENGLKSKLTNKAMSLYTSIYKDCINDEQSGINGSLYLYYQSYKLRGDCPEYYICGRYMPEESSVISFNKPNNRFVSDGIRENPSISYLYYNYLYNSKVKKVGQVKDVFKVDNKYVELVNNVQKQLQYEVSKIGIGIECNPSSNILISTFDKFENHPIFNLNTIDGNSVQLSVSINTDDLGVFDTSLENEYAIMTRALELKKNSEGKDMYTTEQIYSWIDKVREMGNDQAFKV